MKPLIKIKMEYKQCDLCKAHKPISDFRITRWGVYSASCKDCCKKKAMQTIKRKTQNCGIDSNGSYFDDELDDKTPKEVIDELIQRKRWLEHRGYQVSLTYKYERSEKQNLPNEEWRNIKRFPGYMISNYGRVVGKKGHLLKIRKDSWGYCVVGVSHNNSTHTLLVHRAVAEAFIPNPNDLPQINHIDEEKSNNHVDNLEWCTASYNSSYGSRNDTNSLPVLQYSLEGEVIADFPSIKQASEATGLSESTIMRCCRYGYQRARRKNKFDWRFKDE